jgi:hypothetical protein
MAEVQYAHMTRISGVGMFTSMTFVQYHLAKIDIKSTRNCQWSGYSGILLVILPTKEDW